MKAPEITACEAMTVASVAKTISTGWKAGPTIWKKGSSWPWSGSASAWAPLPHVDEDQRGHDDEGEGAAHRVAADVTHVGVERLGAGHREDGDGEDGEDVPAAVHQEEMP